MRLPESRRKSQWLQDYFLYSEIPRLLRRLVTILLVTSLLWALFMSVGRVFGLYFHPITYVFVVFLAAIRLWLQFDESHRPAHAIIWGFMLIFTAHLYLNGGLFAPIILLVPAMIGVAYALLGMRMGHLSLIGYVLVLVLMATLGHFDALPQSKQTHTPITMLLITLTILAISAALFTAIIGTYEQASKVRLRELNYRREAEQRLKLLTENLEHRVEDPTHSLEASLNALESFAFSVTHDLQAPLRGIQMQLSDLNGPEFAHIGEPGKTAIARIETNARFMQKHVEDLLRFARLGHQGINPQMIFLSRLTEEIKAVLSAQQGERNVLWSIGKLPDVYGDPDMIKMVLLNLMGNALKFTRTKTSASIVIDGEEVQNGVMICIRDNGVGFAENDRPKLFKPFERLHPADQFEGTGIGLATCARIIELHKGTITAQGVLNESATFCFTLPKPP